jgi:hypothetical protein
MARAQVSLKRGAMKTTLAALALVVLGSLSACAGEELSPAPGDLAAEPLASSEPPQMLLLSRCEQPSCLVAARRLDGLDARCHDGAERAVCPVLSLQWPGPSDDLMPLAFLPRSSERLLVLGRWRDGALDIGQAFSRAGDGPLPDRWALASARGCDGCVPLWIEPLDGRRGWAEAWLDPAAAPGDEVAHNLALVHAWSPDGLLFSGVKKGVGPRRRVVVHDFFLPRSFRPDLCREDLYKALGSASGGLLWPSETDAPLLPFVTSGPEGDDAAAWAAALQGSPAELEEQPWSWLTRLGEETAGMTLEERGQAARYRSLRAALESHLTERKILVTGSVRRTVWIVGRSRCGELAGVETFVVET